MRRLPLCGLAMAGLLVAQQAPARAQARSQAPAPAPVQAPAPQQCASPSDQTTFELQALKSELMVLATACHDDAQYNAFVTRYQQHLLANEKAFDDYFRRRYGKAGQREHDTYITSLANAQSDGGMHLGSDFCPRNAAIFDEVLALRSANDLQDYVAGKDLVPASLGACAQPPAAPVIKAHATGRATKATHKQ